MLNVVSLLIPPVACIQLKNVSKKLKKQTKSSDKK